MDLGQLVIELVGDYSQLKRDIDLAKAEALKNARELERIYTLSPSLDTKALKLAASEAGVIAGKSIAQGLQKSLNSYKFSNTPFQKAGQEIARGLADGIKSGDRQVQASAARMAGLTIDETKKKLKIQSPSKVFHEIGLDIVRGLSAGIGAGGVLSISGLIESVISTAKATVDSSLAFTGDSIAKYSSFKSISTQLENIQGSSSAAASSLKFLRSEAERLALPLEASAKGFTSLVAATRGTKLAGEVTREIFKGISTVARENNLSNEDYQGVLLATTQMVSKGKISMEELLQIGERVPGTMSRAAKSIGVTTGQLMKLGESGQLTAEVFLPAFARELNKVDATAIAKATDNSTAAFTRLNNRVDELKIALGAAIEPGVTAGLNFVQQTLSELGKAGLFDDLNRGAKEFAQYLRDNPELAKNTADTIRTALKDAISTTVSLAQQLTNYLKANPTAIQDAGSALISFGKSVSTAVTFAQNLLSIFQDIAKSVDEAYTKASKLLGGNSQSQSRFKEFLRFGPLSLIPGLGTGVNSGGNASSNSKSLSAAVGINTGSLSSPIAGKSIQEILAYQPSPGQGFYGMRDGGRRQHSKVDFDSRVGAREGAMTQASLSGSATMRQITSTSAGIDIATTDANGKKITVVYNHLRLDDVKQLFGGQKEIQVSSGQKLGRITKDALSTGAHLDFGIKINGTYVEPQKFIREYAQQSRPSAVVRQTAKQPTPTASEGWMKTMASTYGKGDDFNGKKTASGEIFNRNDFTAAINENLKRNLGVKWGDRVEAINPKNGKSVIVRINDHGPYEKQNGRWEPHRERGLDLSTAAAKEIGISLGEVAFRVIGKNSPANVVSNAVASSQAQAQQPPEIQSILQGQALKESAARREKFRKAVAETQTALRVAQDLDYSAIRNPSLSDRQGEEMRKLQQRYDSELTSATQKREDSVARIGINQSRLGSGSVPEANDLKLQIDLDKRSLISLDGVIRQLSASRAKAITELVVCQPKNAK